MHKLVLLRHGLSEWNIQNRFTGWHDVDLADAGMAESRKAGQALPGYQGLFCEEVPVADRTVVSCVRGSTSDSHDFGIFCRHVPIGDTRRIFFDIF